MPGLDELRLSRRHAMGVVGLSILAGAVGSPRSALSQNNVTASQTGEILIRGGYVLPVDPSIKDLVKGDVHVRGGEIVAVAESIDAPHAEIIDASNTIVMPGFVETHWHMWNSIWRGIANDATAYFKGRVLEPHYTAEDHYTAVQYAALEAINSGITTCHNWAHGLRNYDDAQAEMQALVDMGLRAKISYQGVINGAATPAEDLQRALAWIAENAQGRLGLGMTLDRAGDHFASQVAVARKLGLSPITDHGGFMSKPELVGPEFIFTHGPGMTAKFAGALAAMKVKVALCPGTDPMIGNGLPPIIALLSAGVPLEDISVSVDVTAQTPADPFALLRTLVNAGRIQQIEEAGLTGNLMGIGQAATQWKFSYRDAVTVGTLGGANVLGLANQTGSLTPGKRADIILVRTDDANMLPATNTNPTYQLVQHGEPGNVDTVIIDGQIRKRDGKMVGIDAAAIVAKAANALTEVRKRAGLPPLDTSL